MRYNERVSWKHLVRSFQEATGLDIKSFSTYIRFQSVLKQLNEGRFQSLSEAAAAETDLFCKGCKNVNYGFCGKSAKFQEC